MASSNNGYAAASPSNAVVRTRTSIAQMFAVSPRSRTRFLLNRRASWAPSSEVTMAVSTCGRNMSPYWVLLRSYSVGSVKIVAAAGNVTRVMPWTRPARLTTRPSAADAISPSGGAPGQGPTDVSGLVTVSSDCPSALPRSGARPPRRPP